MDSADSGTTETRVEVPATQRPAREWVWMVRVLAIVVVFGLIAIARSKQVDIPFRDPHGKLFASKTVSMLEMLAVFVLIDVVVRWVKDRRRSSLWRTVRTRWTPYRVAMILAGLLAYQVVYLCYRNLKSWDVLRAPQDDMLLRWDRWLFLGHSPAVLLHDLLGQDLAARLLTDLYESFSMLVTVSLIAALAFTRTVRSAYVFVVAGMWAWILGVGSYYLIPTLGPFHAAPEEFAGLTRTSIQSTQARYVVQRDYLLAFPHAHDAFAQISAFASLHCALSCLIFLMARFYGLKILARSAGVFLAGTVVATVYLGWHFAVDDIAGIAIAVLSVQLGKLVVLGSWRMPRDAAIGP